MDKVIRVGSVVLLLVLGLVAATIVVAIVSPRTDRAEKVALGIFLAATVGSASRIAVIAVGMRRAGRRPGP